MNCKTQDDIERPVAEVDYDRAVTTLSRIDGFSVLLIEKIRELAKENELHANPADWDYFAGCLDDSVYDLFAAEYAEAKRVSDEYDDGSEAEARAVWNGSRL